MKQENKKTKKPVVKKSVAKKTVKSTTKVSPKKERYHQAVGRRKSSVARVRMTPISKTKNEFIINDTDITKYFMTESLSYTAKEAITKTKPKQKFLITVKVVGGGISSQAQAVRHGITRILASLNEEDKKKLKKLGFLKRDPRAKERRKFGLKKARKAAQWKKR